MSKPIGNTLPDEVVDYLVGGNVIAIATTDENDRPYMGLIGSCIAIDHSTVRFAAFGGGRTLANIKLHPGVFIETLGDSLVVGASGTARVVKERMEASAYPPHHYAMVEIAIESVKDDHPPGTSIGGLSYTFGESRDPEDRLRRSAALYAELRNHVSS